MSKKQQAKQEAKKTEPEKKLKEVSGYQDAPVKLKLWLGLLIAVFAFILYAQSISFEYVYDDEGAIQLNKLTQKGIAAIPELFRTDYWYGYREDFRVPIYRPLPLAMFAIEWQLSPDNPHLSHFINVFLFAVSCWLLFVLLTVLFEKKNLLLPFACALLFAVHPIHTEVVDNIKSRDEILCFLLSILSVLSFTKAVRSNSLLFVFAGAATYFLAFFSKETAISYLVLTPLTLFFFTSTGYKPIIKVVAVMALTTGLYFLIRGQVLQSVPPGINDSIINNTLFAAPDYISRQATAFYILLKYLLLLIFPHPLSYDYSFSQIKIQSISDVPALLGLVIYFMMFVYAALNIRKKTILSYAILFYLLTLSPVSNIFFMIGATMAERFIYMPSAGFCIAFALLLMKLTKTDVAKSNFNSINQLISKNAVFFAALVVITALCSFKTFTRSQDWKDNITLYSHDVRVADNSARTHTKYGQLLLLDEYPKEKDQLKQTAILDSAIAELIKSVVIFGDAPMPYEFLGYAYMQKEDYVNAAKHYEKGVAPGGKQFASVYKTLGFLHIKTGNYEKAIQYFDSAVIYFPDSASVHNDLGYALAQMKRYSEALAEYNKAVSLDVGSFITYTNMGLAYLQTKEFNNALQSLTKAVELDSANPQAYLNMAIAYHNMGDDVNAKSYFMKSQSLKK